MEAANNVIRTAEAEMCRPWPRHILSHAEWTALAFGSVAEGWVLLSHWAETAQVHALFLNPAAASIVPVSTAVEAGGYPALSAALPEAAWYERMILDLWGHEAAGSADLRHWLDHGNWLLSPPMAPRPEAQPQGEPIMTPAPEQDEAMVLPLGPVWGRLDEPAHVRLSMNGSSVRRAEALLGFSHKGTLTLMRGKSPRAAARYAARLSADATVAHSVAFALATEVAMGVEAPPRATRLRIVMMEIERIAAHLDNLAEVGRLAGAAMVHARCGLQREILLRASDAAFGHRLMMDCVVPGGVAADIAEDGPRFILRALGDIASEMPAIRRLHDGPVLSSRLTGVGRTAGRLAAFPDAEGVKGVGGVVGRASGYAFDVRNVFVPGYRELAPRTAAGSDGDAKARQHLRIQEIEESLRLIGLALDMLPAGPVTVALLPVSGEGIACAESIRGDVWHWLRLDHGQIAAVFPRDPGWALWPLAQRVLQNAALDDIDLIRASLALPVSGMDL
ncbi:MAG TPA: hydrogenase expression protein HypE [Rhodopila sp.]